MDMPENRIRTHELESSLIEILKSASKAIAPGLSMLIIRGEAANPLDYEKAKKENLGHCRAVLAATPNYIRFRPATEDQSAYAAVDGQFTLEQLEALLVVMRDHFAFGA